MNVLCRVCLCSDRHVSPINNTILQQVWEKLTNAELNNNDGKPLEVCYMCYAHLRKSYQLMKKALKAEVMLTLFVNNGLQCTHNAITKISSLIPEFDYSYAIEEALQCEKITRSEVTEIKIEIEKNNEEENELIIKEEQEVEDECLDSCQEEGLDNVGVKPETVTGDDEPPKKMTPEKILTEEVRVVLEKIDIVPLRRKRKLNEVPQNVKRIKLEEAINGWKPLSSAISKSLPNNNCEASDISSSETKALEGKVEISEITNPVKFCQVDSVSPKVFMTQNEKDKTQNVILQNENEHTKVKNNNSAENESSKQNLSKSTTALAPNLSLLRSNEESKSNICNRERPANDVLCDICHYKCVTKDDLHKHLRKHTKEQFYICNLCDYRCSRKDYLISHMRYKHIKEKNFSCHICQYKFVTKGDLSRHLRKHTMEKTYICDLCDYRCSQKTDLTRHMRYNHIKDQNFSCHIYQYKFITKCDLNNRLRNHSKEKPYICDLCDYRCSIKTNFKRHMQRKHSKEKNFSCHICQYKFVTKGELSKHLLKHTKEKPYTCDLCDYRCSQKGNLKNHMQYKHAKEKNFSCHICQYKFAIKGDLSKHLRKHIKEKPYVCD